MRSPEASFSVLPTERLGHPMTVNGELRVSLIRQIIIIIIILIVPVLLLLAIISFSVIIVVATDGPLIIALILLERVAGIELDQHRTVRFQLLDLDRESEAVQAQEL